MGSSQYRTKGTLDSLANLTYATGTNAWTANDHTAYTVANVSLQGCKLILRVFMNHLMHPLMTDAAFVTEVHHHTSAGESRGVVVGEMQARQNSMEDLMAVQLNQLLYAGTSYQYETGGFVKELRQLTAQECRDFHHEHYHPSNALVVVCGSLTDQDLQELCDALDRGITDDSKYLSQVIKNPWQHEHVVPPLDETRVEHIKFPSEDESTGAVSVAWRLLKGVNLIAIDVLMDYLTDSSVAILDKVFIQDEENQYCSSVDFDIMDYSHAGLELQFSGADVDSMDGIMPLLIETLREHTVDMVRICDMVQRRILTVQQTMETDPEHYLLQRLIPMYLYNPKRPFAEIYNEVEVLQRLITESAEFWQQQLQYFVEAKHVAVLARPSKDMSAQLAAQEKEYARKFVESHTQAELEALDALAKAAKLENDVAVPQEVLDSPEVHQCRMDGKSLIRSQAKQYRYAGNDLVEVQQVTDTLLQVNQVTSEFVTLTCVYDTRHLTDDDSAHLVLLTDVFFALPMTTSDGKQMTADEVVAALEKDTIDYSIGVGLDGRHFTAGQYAEYVTLELTVHRGKYQQGRQWLHDLMNRTRFAEDKLRISVGRLCSDIQDLERQGSFMVRDLANQQLYRHGSNKRALTLEHQKPLLQQLNDGKEFAGAAGKLSAICSKLLQSTPRIQLIGDFAGRHDELKREWALMLQSNLHADIIRASDMLQPLDSVLGTVHVQPMSAIEGSYATFMIRGVNDRHPDAPALMLLCEYLSTMEGPLWRGVRGPGLAYGASLRASMESQFVSLTVYRSPDAQLAHAAALKVMQDDTMVTLDDVSVRAAKCSLTYSLVSRESNQQAAAGEQFIDQVFRQVGTGGIDELLRRVSAVTAQDLRRVMTEYVSKFAAVSQSAGFVTTMPSLTDNMCDAWRAGGYKVVMHEMTAICETEDGESDDDDE